jgi:hypothetical protein
VTEAVVIAIPGMQPCGDTLPARSRSVSRSVPFTDTLSGRKVVSRGLSRPLEFSSAHRPAAGPRFHGIELTVTPSKLSSRLS